MPRRNKKTENYLPPSQYQENPKAKMWLWIGVSVISAIILVMWGWATSISLSSFSWAKTPEKKLIENSRNDWDTLFNNEESKIKNDRLKLQIKNILTTIVAETNTSSTTTTITTTNTTTLNTTSPN